jgi:hypothetical protein
MHDVVAGAAANEQAAILHTLTFPVLCCHAQVLW